MRFNTIDRKFIKNMTKNQNNFKTYIQKIKKIRKLSRLLIKNQCS